VWYVGEKAEPRPFLNACSCPDVMEAVYCRSPALRLWLLRLVRRVKKRQACRRCSLQNWRLAAAGRMATAAVPSSNRNCSGAAGFLSVSPLYPVILHLALILVFSYSSRRQRTPPSIAVVCRRTLCKRDRCLLIQDAQSLPTDELYEKDSNLEPLYTVPQERGFQTVVPRGRTADNDARRARRCLRISRSSSVSLLSISGPSMEASISSGRYIDILLL